MSSTVVRGWRRNVEVYSVMLGSMFIGSQVVHQIVRPNMEVPAALNLEHDKAQEVRKDHK